MAVRTVKEAVRGRRTVDGAGVHLVRVLDNDTVRSFDPFLMLDSFDSKNPEDYIKGFPLHPHRGIETITYLIKGEIDHEDTLGNKGVILSGQSQWMTAGSGILHQEMPQAVPHLLGLQIWLNMRGAKKMTRPAYFEINEDVIGVAEEDFGVVRVLSGKYKDTAGVVAPHVQATIYDVSLDADREIELPTEPEENVFVFLVVGDVWTNGKYYAEKTALLFGEGDSIRLKAGDTPCRFMFFSGKPLGEPVSWGGPIVMNTEAELLTAFQELRNGSFIKENAM